MSRQSIFETKVEVEIDQDAQLSALVKAELTPGERLILAGKMVLCLSDRELAEAMGTSRRSVTRQKSRISRKIRKLQQTTA